MCASPSATSPPGMRRSPVLRDADDTPRRVRLDPDTLEDKKGMTTELTTDEVAQTLTSYRVGRRVNSAEKADPSDPNLIAPID